MPLAMTSLSPCRFLVMRRESVWYHSMVGGGSPTATHSNLAPEELEKVAVLGGSILQTGARPPPSPPRLTLIPLPRRGTAERPSITDVAPEKRLKDARGEYIVYEIKYRTKN